MTKPHFSPWGRLYVTSVVLLGIAAIAQSAYDLYVHPIGWNWFILAVLTLISGSATVKLPSVPATISISETFVFTSVLLFGPSAGTLTVALDALVISLWLARRGHPFYRIAFNVCALPAALWLGAQLFYALAPPGFLPLSTTTQPVAIGSLLTPLVFFTVSYFLLNSWLIALAISLEKRLSPLRVWRENFAWISLNYFGGASIAALLVTYTRNIDYAYLAFVLPLLAVLYVTFAVSMGRVEDANRHLTQLNTLYMSTIETLAMAIDAKDQITHGHIRRVQHLAVGLAKAIGVTDEEQIRAIEAASLLHDMGKLAVPEYILNKPGPLTPAEFEKMKLHASVGADILSAIDFPYPVVPIVRHHHENWDGTGYPDGLGGSQIPIGARVLSVVDCFDALTSDRPYRPRLSDADAIKILVDRRGKMYDPLVVDTFLAVHTSIAPPAKALGSAEDRLSAIARGLTKHESITAGERLSDIAASAEETVVLYDLAKGLSGQLDLPTAADVISKHLRRIVPSSTTVFYVYDVVSDDLVVEYAGGENSGHFHGLRIPRGQRLTGWVGANKQTIINSDPILDLGDSARTMNPRLTSCLSTPLLIGNDLVGVLSIYSTQRGSFTEDHRRVVEAVARQVAQTVRQAVEAAHLRPPSYTTDQLTAVPSIQQVERFLSSEIESLAPGATLSIVYVEVPFWRILARRESKSAADEALNEFAGSVKRLLRGADTLLRLSNDELVVLLVQTDAEVAASVSTRILRQIHTSQHAVNSKELRLTAVGVATAPQDGKTVEGLVSCAKRRARPSSDDPDRGKPLVH